MIGVCTQISPFSSGFVRIAGEQGNLVALRVSQIRHIEMRSVGGAETRLALVRSACDQCCGVQVAHLLLAAYHESHHGAIASRGRAPVESGLDVEIGRGAGCPRRGGKRVAQPLRSLLQSVTQGGQEG